MGIFLPADPNGPDELMQQGKLRFPFGKLWFKWLSLGTGQADVKTDNRRLRDLIIAGRATPGFIVSQEIGLDEAVDAYQHFDARDDGWTKVVLHPWSAAPPSRLVVGSGWFCRAPQGAAEVVDVEP